MSNISAWSKTAANNNATAPNGWPEGQAPSTVNDCGREVMAAVRTFYENIEWRDWGHTPTRTGNTTFTIPTDVTAIYVANRRIQCTDATTLYGIIVSAVYSSVTTITVTLDSGTLSSSLTAVALGPTPTNNPIDAASVKRACLIGANDSFAADTKMVFHMASAPTGWTQDTTEWDHALRVVGTAGTGTGGTIAFSTISAQTVANHTLTTAEIPVHSHTNTISYALRGSVGPGATSAGLPGITMTEISGSPVPDLTAAMTVSISNVNAGSGNAHNHDVGFQPKYTDVIICQKD